MGHNLGSIDHLPQLLRCNQKVAFPHEFSDLVPVGFWQIDVAPYPTSRPHVRRNEEPVGVRCDEFFVLIRRGFEVARDSSVSVVIVQEIDEGLPFHAGT